MGNLLDDLLSDLFQKALDLGAQVDAEDRLLTVDGQTIEITMDDGDDFISILTVVETENSTRITLVAIIALPDPHFFDRYKAIIAALIGKEPTSCRQDADDHDHGRRRQQS
jgi:hypothetical protein